MLNNPPRPVVREAMNCIAGAVGGFEQILTATEREPRIANPTGKREQQGYATSRWLFVSTRKVLMGPEHLARSVRQHGPPAETIEAEAHKNTCAGTAGRIRDRNGIWGVHRFDSATVLRLGVNLDFASNRDERDGEDGGCDQRAKRVDSANRKAREVPQRSDSEGGNSVTRLI